MVKYVQLTDDVHLILNNTARHKRKAMWITFGILLNIKVEP